MCFSCLKMGLRTRTGAREDPFNQRTRENRRKTLFSLDDLSLASGRAAIDHRHSAPRLEIRTDDNVPFNPRRSPSVLLYTLIPRHVHYQLPFDVFEYLASQTSADPISFPVVTFGFQGCLSSLGIPAG